MILGSESLQGGLFEEGREKTFSENVKITKFIVKLTEYYEI